MRVGLTYDLDANILQIAAAIENLGHTVIRIGSAFDLVDKLAAGQRFDLVFNGCRGQETSASASLVPELLSLYGVPCTFSSPAILNICNQRCAMKSLLRDRGVPTSDYWLVETLGDIPRVDATYPVTVGPTTRCCASTCPVANDAAELSKACCQVMSLYATPALVEPCMSGQEFQVALLGSGGSASVLMPAEVPAALASSIERIARAAWRTVGGYDAGCVTLKCDTEGQPHVMNIEPMPSLAENSVFMQLAQATDLSLSAVVERIMKTCGDRVGMEGGHQLRRPHILSTNLVSDLTQN